MIIRRGLLGIIVCGLLAPHAVRAQERPPARDAIVVAARDVMATARYCTLVTIDSAGHPQARVVDPFPPEADMVVWVGTQPLTRKVAQIRADPRVTMLCYEPARMAYVTLLGTAEIVTDSNEKARHWKPEWSGFYKDANRGDDYVLLRIRTKRIEIASEAHGMRNDPLTWRPVVLDLQ